MPRKAREKSETGIYHIILQGINRQSIFEDEEDRQKIIKTLERYKRESGYRIYAYCLMDNHIHILLHEEKEPIGMIIKRISASYVYWYNSKHKRCGHLFQERFKSEVVNTDIYFLTVLRYIHQNPVKAGIADEISEYKCSSYTEYVGGSKIIDTEFALKMFSEIPDQAIKRFEKYSREKSEEKCLDIEENKAYISDDDIREIVRRQFGIEAIEIINEVREKQDNIVRKVKEINGVNIRQIARVTGLSQTRVWKA